VVEDGEVNQMVAVGILEQLSYDAVVAEHALAALDALRTGAFDAAVLERWLTVSDRPPAPAPPCSSTSGP